MKAFVILLALPLATASLLPRATTLPAATGTLALPQGTSIPAGGSYDGKLKKIDNGRSCALDVEYGEGDYVFRLGDGATLSNVIIGPNQKKGIKCLGKCTLNNVWWSNICYFGLDIVGKSADAKVVVKGGGAIGSSSINVIENAGSGPVEVSNFFADGFSTFYKSCGNCSPAVARKATLTGITAKNGVNLAGINSNFGDTATIKSSTLTKVTNACTRYQGVTSTSQQAKKLGSGADGKNCIYGSDVVFQ